MGNNRVKSFRRAFYTCKRHRQVEDCARVKRKRIYSASLAVFMYILSPLTRWPQLCAPLCPLPVVHASSGHFTKIKWYQINARNGA